MPQSCSLSKALSYDNDEVVKRFVQLYDISGDEASDIFVETKKWLWLASQVESHAIAIIDPLLIIDEMWHNFVLFTLDYTRYCLDCFGRYIHHLPTTQREKDRRKLQLKEDPTRAKEEQMLRLHRQCALIITKLGSATLLKWFVDYPERYNEQFFNNRRKFVSLSYVPPASLKTLASYFTAGRIGITEVD